jgi:hypothetical protein
LGRALDLPCAVGALWEVWAASLEQVRAAAAASGDRASEGWALHQLGTRLLCLDDPVGAKPLLTQALAIRESLGDRMGVAVTHHNLGFLNNPVALPPRPAESARPRPNPLRLLIWLAAAVLVFMLVAVATWIFSAPAGRNRETETAEPVTREASPSPIDNPADDPVDVVTDTPPDTALSTDPTDESSTTDTPVEEEPEPQTPPERPAMALSPGEVLDFGDVNVGDNREHTVTVQNTGNAPLKIDAISISGERAEELTVGDDCDGEILDPGDTCAFPVTFEPTEPGSRSLRLTVSDRASGIEQTLAVRGNAVRAEAEVQR